MTTSGYVIASKRIVNDKLPVKFMYREQPDNDQDSGWRFFAGIESQKYVDNPNNMVLCDIYSILSIDKSIVSHLDADIGVAYERQRRNEPFKQIQDFDFATDNGER